jgi:hypothetical protein
VRSADWGDDGRRTTDDGRLVCALLSAVRRLPSAVCRLYSAFRIPQSAIRNGRRLESFTPRQQLVEGEERRAQDEELGCRRLAH